MHITRITRKYVDVTLTATLRKGETTQVDQVDVAVLPRGANPNGSTVWQSAPVIENVVTFLVAGPDADPAGALHVRDDGSDVWGRVTDHPEVDVACLVEITVY